MRALKLWSCGTTMLTCSLPGRWIRGVRLRNQDPRGALLEECEVASSRTHGSTLSQGTMIRTLKRYSAFVKLRKDLLETFPRLKPLIPPLPPKSSLGASLFSPSSRCNLISLSCLL